jgi:hypothetical protein
MLALERSDHGFSGESRGGYARRERLPQAGLLRSHRRWATRHSLSGRKQDATPRHVTTPTPERCFSTEWPERLWNRFIAEGSDYCSRRRSLRRAPRCELRRRAGSRDRRSRRGWERPSRRERHAANDFQALERDCGSWRLPKLCPRRRFPSRPYWNSWRRGNRTMQTMNDAWPRGFAFA